MKMARCSFFREKGNLVKINNDNVDETDFSESDEEVASFLINMKGEKTNDSSQCSSKDASDNQHVNNGPVFSLDCLHDDKPDTVADIVETIDIDDVPELKVKLDENLQIPQSINLKSVETPEVIDIDDIPELVVKPAEGDSPNQESINLNSIEAPEIIDIDDIPDLEVKPTAQESQVITPKIEQLKQLFLLVPENLQNIVPAAVSQLDSPSHMIFTRNVFEGKHNFKIGISCPRYSKRSEPVLFCERQNKLYVTKDNPFKVVVKADNVPPGSLIKVTAVYSQPEHSNTSYVHRCPTHAHQDFVKGIHPYEHVVVSTSDPAIYKKENNLLSVSVPYEKPQSGEMYTFYLFKLTCFSSCLGGINRRPFSLVFALEKDGITLGRQFVNTKACASPWRDYGVDTQRLNKKLGPNNSVVNGFSAIKVDGKEQKTAEKYSITVEDIDLFKFLKEMKNLYEAGVLAQQISKTNI